MLRYIIERTRSVLPIKALCHYAAVQVDRYDKENGTEFLLTLETYLANNKSLLEAANKLFVHKSTISYRLKCINQITTIDYNDPDERIQVLVSCMILRAFNELNNS